MHSAISSTKLKGKIVRQTGASGVPGARRFVISRRSIAAQTDIESVDSEVLDGDLQRLRDEVTPPQSCSNAVATLKHTATLFFTDECDTVDTGRTLPVYQC